jgi:hypothetical protein
MHLTGSAAMISLEREASLRVEQATQLEIVCVAGVVWITQTGDTRDLFIAAGESLSLSPRGLTLVTALEPATVHVIDRRAPGKAAAWWRWAIGLGARVAALVRSREAVVRI